MAQLKNYITQQKILSQSNKNVQDTNQYKTITEYGTESRKTWPLNSKIQKKKETYKKEAQ